MSACEIHAFAVRNGREELVDVRTSPNEALARRDIAASDAFQRYPSDVHKLKLVVPGKPHWHYGKSSVDEIGLCRWNPATQPKGV